MCLINDIVILQMEFVVDVVGAYLSDHIVVVLAMLCSILFLA